MHLPSQSDFRTAKSARSESALPSSRSNETPLRPLASNTSGGTTGGGQFLLNTRRWNGARAEMRSSHCDGCYEADLSSDTAQLIVFLEEVGGAVGVSFDGGNHADLRDRGARRLSMVPAGMSARANAEPILFVRSFTLAFDPGLAIRVSENTDIAPAFEPRFMFSDSRILRIVELLANECTDENQGEPMFGDSLVLAIIFGLLDVDKESAGATSGGGLAPWQVKRVSDYLEANIADCVRLDQLAAVVQLSLSHFCRSFKISTGLAPHRWVLEARIRRAKQLLLDWSLPLAQVAIETGFSDQAHFTRAFGRASGQSPGVWRKARHA